MLKQSQRMKMLQKISPQQIQFIKLLQIPTATMEQRIKDELEKNAALEDDQLLRAEEDDDDSNDQYSDLDKTDEEYDNFENEEATKEAALEDYIDYSNEYDYKTSLPSTPRDEEDEYEAPIIQMKSLFDVLQDQLALLDLDELSYTIGEHIIGSIDDDGYLRRPTKALVLDLAFRYQLSVKPEQVEVMIGRIQRFDPAGIAARDLQECLLLQLRRRESAPAIEHARILLEKYFDEFTKKHFAKIRSRMSISEEELRAAYDVITHLNPKPGESQSLVRNEYIIPDFTLTLESGDIKIRLNSRNAPDLKVSRSYRDMYTEYKGMHKAANKKNPKVKETFDFVKQRIEAAQWFIDAIRQRQFTLLNTMEAIAGKQIDFFISEGDDKKLRPMILKDIAEEVGMDISTISRVANSKYVQTDFGIFPLKYFFTEGIETEGGEIVSNREVKKSLEEIIGVESKRKPLSDDKIAEMLKDKGYNIARRTVAKYREQLGIPVARLRKEV
ncbi:MAG: RNA polymerase factor sigma-54 [Bacteroidia bacterium]